MITKLAVYLLAVLCLIAMFAKVSTSLETIQYDELTCDELAFSYTFNLAVVQDIMRYYDGCVDFADSPASVGPNDMLACKFVREHGLFVQGIINDIVGVYNIKCAAE